MSGRTISGGVDDRSAAYSANSTRAELTSVLTGRSLIEPYKFTDTLRDKITLCFVCMVVCSIAVLFGVFLYIGFFFRA